jgi:hypothetical protein
LVVYIASTPDIAVGKGLYMPLVHRCSKPAGAKNFHRRFYL